MSGEEVKEILKQEGIVLSDLARLMGFDSDQRLHSALNAKDVKSGLLEKIAHVTNKNICMFYPDTAKTIANDNSITVSGNGNQISAISEKFIGLLEKKDEHIDRLLTVIEKLNKQ